MGQAHPPSRNTRQSTPLPTFAARTLPLRRVKYYHIKTNDTKGRLQQLGSWPLDGKVDRSCVACLRLLTLVCSVGELPCTCPGCTVPKLPGITQSCQCDSHIVKHPAICECVYSPNNDKRAIPKADCSSWVPGFGRPARPHPAVYVARLRLLTLVCAVGELPCTCPSCTVPKLSGTAQSRQRHSHIVTHNVLRKHPVVCALLPNARCYQTTTREQYQLSQTAATGLNA